MLNPEQLSTFVAVAETGSFSAAAARLGFTQPGVSRQIKALEATLGEVRLFRRVGKTVRLTHAGEELLVHARDVVALLTRTEQHMLGLRGQVTGRVAIGCLPDGGEQVVAELVAAFHAKQPNVQFAVDTGAPDALLGWLEREQVQAVVLDAAPPQRMHHVLAVRREPVVTVCALDHPLRTASNVSFAEIAEQHLILPPRSMALRRALDELFRRHGGELFAGQIVLETAGVLGALQGARAGMGVTFVPAQLATSVPDVAVVPVHDLLLEHTWYLVRQHGTTQRAVEAWWNFVAASVEAEESDATEPGAQP